MPFASTMDGCRTQAPLYSLHQFIEGSIYIYVPKRHRRCLFRPQIFVIFGPLAAILLSSYAFFTEFHSRKVYLLPFLFGVVVSQCCAPRSARRSGRVKGHDGRLRSCLMFGSAGPTDPCADFGWRPIPAGGRFSSKKVEAILRRGNITSNVRQY